MSALRVVLVSHTASVLGLVLLAFATHASLPNRNELLWGVVAGVAGGIALMSFYTALSLGEMGSSAALSGLIAAAIPVVVALRTEGFPGWLRIAGFLLAAIAIWLIAAPSEHAAHAVVRRRAQWLALTAGAGFGVFMAAIKVAGEGGVVYALASARIGSLSITLLALLWVGLWSRVGPRPESGQGIGMGAEVENEEEAGPSTPLRSAQDDNPVAQGTGRSPRKNGVTLRGVQWALIAALLDTSGNLLYIVATRVGRLDVAAVLGSLYPASTMLLAAWMLHERPTRRQSLGMAAALAAVVAITAG